MKTPAVSQKRKLVRLLAEYINKDGASIKIQQKAYNAWMSYFQNMELQYPEIDFRSEETMNSLVSMANKEAKKKLFRGAGSTF